MHADAPCGMDGAIGQEENGTEDLEVELNYLSSQRESRYRELKSPGPPKVVEIYHKSIVKPNSQCPSELCRHLLNSNLLDAREQEQFFPDTYTKLSKKGDGIIAGVNVHST